MDRETWRKISDIFSDYLECADTERPALLARLEQSDPEIAREVKDLLNSYSQDQAFLEPRVGAQKGVEPLAAAEYDSSPGILASQLRPPGTVGTRRRSPVFWLLLAANLAIAGCFWFSVSIIARHRGMGGGEGWNARPTEKGWVITDVYSPGPASGILQPGDYVVSVNQERMWLPRLVSVPLGKSYSVQVIRNGATRDFVLAPQEIPNRRWFGGLLAYLLVSLTYFLTAIVISILQPGPMITRLAWAALVGEAVTVLCMLLRPYEGFLAPGSYAIFQCMQLMDGPHLALSFHFYWQVFRAGRLSRRSLVLVWFLYGWAAIGSLYRLATMTRYSFAPVTPFFWRHMTLFQRVDTFHGLFYLIAPLSVCLAVGHSYWRAKRSDDRRRATWIVAGSLAGIVPYLVLRWASAIGLTGADYAGVYGILPATLIPIATGYAILKHRLFDINMVLRRGARYLVARNFLRFVLALPALALAYSLITNAHRTVADVILHNVLFISLVVLIAIILKFRERLSMWLDRRFFRERYPQERILLDSIEALRSVDSAPDIGRRVAERLRQALHPENMYFFYFSAQDRMYVEGYGSDSRANGVQIPEGSALPDLLDTSEEPVHWTSLPTRGVPPMCWTWLQTLRTDLIVPLHRSDGPPAGFLLLGRKMSEEPYSAADRSLLLGLARQMTLAYEMLQLEDRLLHQQRTNQKMRARVESVGTNWVQECPQCGRCYDCAVHCCSDDGVELVFSIPVQRVLDARYRLDRVLGRGGMGTVFAAHDLRLNRDVAVKVVQAGRISDSAWLRRFSRESRALARLQHENIVLTYDFGVVEEEAAYLVMEFVAGSTLRKEIDSARISPATAAVWFQQLLDGVRAAHAAGIVHRDLKPENVLIASSHPGRVKIADFGVAKWLNPEPGSVSLTLPGTIVGSLHYMSPEQLAGQSVDTRSDLFSVGVMAFEVLVGRVPFSGTNYAEQVASILHGPEPFQTCLQNAPALQQTFRRCLARDPAERFPSAEALQAELIPQIRQYRTDPRDVQECA